MPTHERTNSTSPGTSSTDWTLIVEQPDQISQEVFLQHGLTIGRSAHNTIVIEHPEVELLHARIVRQSDGNLAVECATAASRVLDMTGRQLQSLLLEPDVSFRIGPATLTCKHSETRSSVIVTKDPWRHRCPRCHAALVDLPDSARECPACRVRLRYFRSASALDGKQGFQGWLPLTVGPYRIRAFAAEGGMGIVLRGIHETTEMPAAIKILRVDNDDASGWQSRFEREAAMLKQIRHRHIVRFLEHGQDQHLLWLATDWVDGMPLARVIHEARTTGKGFSQSQVTDLLTQLAEGLMRLHQYQIIHRDLKPSNVLVGADRHVKLADFGVAKGPAARTMQTGLTQTGMVLGTVGYMSPEQQDGRDLTTATDVFSFGVIWYEMLAGQRPTGTGLFQGGMARGWPQSWRAMIERCLLPRPEDRPSMTDVQQVITGRGAVANSLGNRASQPTSFSQVRDGSVTPSQAKPAEPVLTPTGKKNRPWSGITIAILGLLLFTPVWAAIMGALNWRRLGEPGKSFRPLLVCVLCLFAFFVWDPDWTLWMEALWGSTALLLYVTDLRWQQKAYRTFRAGGGCGGNWFLPVSAGLLVGGAQLSVPLFISGYFDHERPALQSLDDQFAQLLEMHDNTFLAAIRSGEVAVIEVASNHFRKAADSFRDRLGQVAPYVFSRDGKQDLAAWEPAALAAQTLGSEGLLLAGDPSMQRFEVFHRAMERFAQRVAESRDRIHGPSQALPTPDHGLHRSCKAESPSTSRGPCEFYDERLLRAFESYEVALGSGELNEAKFASARLDEAAQELLRNTDEIHGRVHVRSRAILAAWRELAKRGCWLAEADRHHGEDHTERHRQELQAAERAFSAASTRVLELKQNTGS